MGCCLMQGLGFLRIWGARLFFIILLCWPLAGSAKESAFPGADLRFEDEQRSLICTATGYVCPPEEENEEAAYEKALAVAERFALRKSHEILQRRLSDVGSGFGFELVRFGSSGKRVNVLQKERVSSAVESSRRTYAIRIIAEVRYRLTGYPDSEKLLSDSHLPLTVRVWSDKNAYTAGEKVVFRIRGNKDYHARIIDIAPGGGMYQILPNLFRSSHSFEGGETYKFPDKALGDKFDLDVAPPYGEERILVYAGDVPIGEVPFSDYAGQFGVVAGKEEEIGRHVRKFIPQMEGVIGPPGAFSCVEFFESRWRVRTSEK